MSLPRISVRTKRPAERSGRLSLRRESRVGVVAGAPTKFRACLRRNEGGAGDHTGSPESSATVGPCELPTRVHDGALRGGAMCVRARGRRALRAPHKTLRGRCAARQGPSSGIGGFLIRPFQLSSAQLQPTHTHTPQGGWLWLLQDPTPAPPAHHTVWVPWGPASVAPIFSARGAKAN